MKTGFAKIMGGCLEGMSAEDRQNTRDKKLAMCPCVGKDLREEDKKALEEKMKAFCGSKKGRFFSLFGKSRSTTDQTCC